MDAIDSENLIAGTSLQSRWQEIKARVNARGAYEEEAEKIHSLLSELDQSVAISGTWMEKRWRAAEMRIYAGSAPATPRFVSA